MSAVLEVKDLRTTFPLAGRRVPIVDGISFSVDAGQVLAIVGESGSGKSITALSVLRLVPKPGRIDGGRVLLDGKNLLEANIPAMRRVRGHDIAMIFQEPMTSLNPVVRVGAQVMEAVLLHERVSKAAARDRGLELFRRVGIPDPVARFDAYPHQLSGGLKQRVMIAMALVTRPRVLLADEPTTALDVTIQAQILELMRELQRDFRTAIVLITHDLGVVNELADEIAVMYAGRFVERGAREAVLSQPSHPYTQGLLASMPSRNEPGKPLYEIRGVVPGPDRWPPGCRFCDRCDEAIDVCRDTVPGPVQLEPGHVAWCHVVERARRGGAQ
ncbi:MAG: ABC transporter ATP-binding protein [Myxococcales bacterium]|jgi:peptide/nickel transport system ATP-binding protein|nr:ABC transporter ATP-binding protein [Myxococcales bacterium]